jgi:divalent metal cation (Fe/Co/Zn/Cd) transporter
MQYISVEHQRAIGERFKVASMIVLAFCVSVGVFALIGRLIEPPETLPYSERLNSIIPAVVIVMAMGVIVLRRIWMTAMVMRMATRTGVSATLSRLLQMTVVCAALSEMVAIVGFLFYLLTGNYRYSLILCLVSLLLLFYTAFPRRREWERAVAAAAKAQA